MGTSVLRRGEGSSGLMSLSKEHYEMLAGLGGFSLGGLLYNVAVSRWVASLGAAAASHPMERRWCAYLDRRVSSSPGIPLRSWLLSAALQGFGYTSLLALAWHHRTSNWADDGLGLFAPGLDRYYLRLFMYAFFGYLVRDLPDSKDDPLFVAHHLCCMGGILTTLTAAPDSGSTTATLGIASLEVGSFFFNLWCLDDTMRKLKFRFWPGRFINEGYHILFPISNIVAAFFLYTTAKNSAAAGSNVFAGWSALSGTILIGMRILEQVKALMGSTPKPTLIPLKSE